jgi:hypothetical protein
MSIGAAGTMPIFLGSSPARLEPRRQIRHLNTAKQKNAA